MEGAEKRCRLYYGRVWHTRCHPATHSFNYKIAMVCVDLDKSEAEFKGLWPLASTDKGWWAFARFRESDHLKDIPNPSKHNISLAEKVRILVESKTGYRPKGSICLLSHLSYFGYCFNPVSFYYCHDEEGNLQVVVAEVSNTPWEEMHTYVLHSNVKNVDTKEKTPSTPYTHRYRFKKEFHVSPFMDMEHTYDFSFQSPEKQLQVNTSMFKGSVKWFTATLRMESIGW
eukprot:CAMPEP_0167747364 /NCGR_PEP_ID=MMETSP0110_2-20121227/4243_1 /TAXON_ID=629695 /ORGANISM="Gymnochlora sp., Strain CCMP2014" /LENGTH=227 /DNA_ID=CAMNT_0007632263 /DNA_START=1 /DNA_END=681 /DNA_ORIENTATION=-